MATYGYTAVNFKRTKEKLPQLKGVRKNTLGAIVR
jgi:hypothetical protein